MLSEFTIQRSFKVDESIEAFERAWKADAVPEIVDFLPTPSHALFSETLLELVRVDLELRWQHGCALTLDEYRLKFPKLLSDSEAFTLVAFEEFRARRNSGELVTPVEYERRFGVLTDKWPVVPVKNADPDSSASMRRLRPLRLSSSDGDEFPVVGTELLNFSLQSEVGRGAISRVYLARQGDLANRLVVLKVSSESFAEADKIAQLQHANIVPIYSVHRVGNLSVVCMPYFGVATLADVVREFRKSGSLPQSGRAIVETLKNCARRTQQSGRRLELVQDGSSTREAFSELESNLTKVTGDEGRLQAMSQMSYVEAVLWIGAKLADGLNHAHERGILHRDLKPANVLLADDGQPMMLDFNLSEDLKQSTSDPESLVGGTMPYMAPEQVFAFQHRMRSGDARSDIYSLGVILFELLSGRYPFPVRDSASLENTLANMALDLQQLPPKIRASHSEVTPAVEAIIQRCLSADLRHRYQTAAELQEDLERHLKQLPLRYAREPSVYERVRKWIRRHSRLTSVIGILLMVIGISVAVEAHQKRQRLGVVEAEIRGLMQAGQHALDNDDADVAHGRFLSAWMKVQAEPTLINYQLGVAGWLDHSRMAVIQNQWQKRAPPREFDERRDEALLLSLLLEQPAEEQVPTARSAILTAINLTIPGDSGWTRERELLTIIESELIEFESGAEDALKYLGGATEFSSRLYHSRRAELLMRLGRNVEAGQAWHQAVQFPPDQSSDDLLRAMMHARRQEFDLALRNFEHVLDLQPESFIARLFQAICFLRLNRPGEAKVALTACIAQRPSLMWCHLFRGRASAALGDEKGAVFDLQRVLDSKTSPSIKRAALETMQSIRTQ